VNGAPRDTAASRSATTGCGHDHADGSIVYIAHTSGALQEPDAAGCEQTGPAAACVIIDLYLTKVQFLFLCMHPYTVVISCPEMLNNLKTRTWQIPLPQIQYFSSDPTIRTSVFFLKKKTEVRIVGSELKY